MATKVTVDLEDDLDGSTIGVRTVQFALDGTSYEIDLSSTNYHTFKALLADYIEKGRLAGRSRPQVRTQQRTTEARERAKAIRTWAQEHDIPVEDHGRIPARVLRQYEQAHTERNEK